MTTMITPVTSLRSRVRRLIVLAALLAGLPAVLPGSAHAQYFGRNKIQYEDFDWYIVETERFDVHAYTEENDSLVLDAGRMAERWYSRYGSIFDHEFDERKPLIFYADQPDFHQTNTTPSTLSQATGGFTESLKDRVVMPFAETMGDTDHVLGHELVHAFQYDIAKEAAVSGGQQGLQRLPLWVVEGLAEYLSIGRDDPHTAMWLRDAVLADELPEIKDLGRDPRFFPYRWGHAFWAFVGGRWGDSRVAQLYQAMAREGVDIGARTVLATDVDTLSLTWIATTKDYYQPLLEGRDGPAAAGKRLLAPDIDAGEMNLSPVLSPDGTRVAFLSERDLFTIDLFLADAQSGQVLGKLAESERDPHFDAIAFISSAGAWSPDGHRFAFATFTEGDGGIAVSDADRRQVDRFYDLGDVGEVHSLAWSPDGASIAFSGSTGGLTDLWLLDVGSGAIEKLTNDAWAELHPDFSPDGGTIAFATDRSDDARLADLDFPSMGLGFYDRATREIRVDRPFGENTKHINPRYAPDGSLYFISDREGFSDVYRMDLESGEVFQVTRMATGVSGITAMGPALTVARDTGDLLFTVFEEGNYIGYRRAAAESRGDLIVRGEVPAPAGTLPPIPPSSPILVANYLAEPNRGLLERSAFSRQDYKSKLALDYVSPPTAGVAVDRWGVGAGGSIGLWFSDMLGNRQVLTAFQGTGGLKDIGGEALFINQGGRFNWGFFGGRIPYRAGFSRVFVDEINGVPATAVDLILERTFYNRVGVLGEYPFSTTRRVEMDAGFLRIGFDREVIRGFFINGQQVAEDRFDLDAPDPLNLAQASVALVNDFSYFGYTSPVRGGRNRFEIGGNAGTFDFATVLADWRRYFYLNPLTFAVRGLHFGRYGSEAEEQLTPLYLGSTSLVRGYSSGSFDVDECTGTEESTCPEFDRLTGSRIAVASLELRVPLLGTERFGLIDAGGFLPVEVSLFGDAGAAWNSDDDLQLKFDRDSIERIPVFSAGASARMNLLGSAVIELYYAYPFQRDIGWEFGFQLAPGW
ncbi:MAG TPA: BamA/TamA family outer membrane protein [Gemmatimonadota bacterium]|nr:BamA/TamA family outer membrane protein [Gemmatimonadota bacterium]